MRNRLSKIGSEPVKVILPPVSVGDRPMLFINCSNAALMLKFWVLCLLATTILPSDLPNARSTSPFVPVDTEIVSTLLDGEQSNLSVPQSELGKASVNFWADMCTFDGTLSSKYQLRSMILSHKFECRMIAAILLVSRGLA